MTHTASSASNRHSCRAPVTRLPWHGERSFPPHTPFGCRKRQARFRPQRSLDSSFSCDMFLRPDAAARGVNWRPDSPSSSVSRSVLSAVFRFSRFAFQLSHPPLEGGKRPRFSSSQPSSGLWSWDGFIWRPSDSASCPGRRTLYRFW